MNREIDEGRISTGPLIACLTRKIESGSLQGQALGFEYGIRASMFQLSNDFGRALKDNDRAIALVKDPRAANSFVAQRCFVLGMLSRFAEALTDCDRAISIDPNFFLYRAYRAAIYLKMGENAKALKEYDETLNMLASFSPQDAPFHKYGRGIAKRRLGDRPGGDKDISEALADSARTRDTYTGWGITE